MISRGSLLIALYLMFSLVVVLYFSIQAPGGIDLYNYKIESDKGFLHWSSYQAVEFVSWFFVKVAYFVSNMAGLDTPTFALNILMWILLSLSVSRYGISSSFFFIVLMTPFGVMLSFNVLRQYVSVVIVFIVLINLANRNVVLAVLFAVLAAFSHSSSVLLCAVIFAAYFVNYVISVIGMVFFSIFLIQLFNYLGLSLDFGGNYTEVGAVSERSKFLGYFIFLTLIFLVFKVKNFLFSKNMNHRENFFSDVINNLMIFVFLMSLFGLPYWVINRVIISVSFLILMSLFLLRRGTIPESIFLISFSIFSILTVIIHPGAKSMLVG